MLNKKSIRLNDGWITATVLSLRESFRFSQIIKNDGQLYNSFGYMQPDMRVNCKEGIISPTPPKGWDLEKYGRSMYTKIGPGWFLTDHEIGIGTPRLDKDSNSREVYQMQYASLYNYLCEQ